MDYRKEPSFGCPKKFTPMNMSSSDDELMGAQVDILAFMDETSEKHAEHEESFNNGARLWHCLPPGGTHVVYTGRNDMNDS